MVGGHVMCMWAYKHIQIPILSILRSDHNRFHCESLSGLLVFFFFWDKIGIIS